MITHNRRIEMPIERVAGRLVEAGPYQDLIGMLALVILMIVVLLLTSGSVGG